MESNKMSTLTSKLDVRDIDAYSDAGSVKKEAFLKNGKAWLKNLAGLLGMDSAQYDLRINRGGVAVSGEVTLYSDSLYVQLLESAVGAGGVHVLYRSCRGRKDYTGGANHWLAIAALREQGKLAKFISECKELASDSQHA